MPIFECLYFIKGLCRKWICMFILVCTGMTCPTQSGLWAAAVSGGRVGFTSEAFHLWDWDRDWDWPYYQIPVMFQIICCHWAAVVSEGGTGKHLFFGFSSGFVIGIDRAFNPCDTYLKSYVWHDKLLYIVRTVRTMYILSVGQFGKHLRILIFVELSLPCPYWQLSLCFQSMWYLKSYVWHSLKLLYSVRVGLPGKTY